MPEGRKIGVPRGHRELNLSSDSALHTAGPQAMGLVFSDSQQGLGVTAQAGRERAGRLPEQLPAAPVAGAERLSGKSFRLP